MESNSKNVELVKINKDLNQASSTKRLIHLVVDFFSFAILFRLIGEFFGFIFNINIEENPDPYVLFMFIAFLINYGFMELKFQKTLGKFMTKTKVVNLNGEKPSNKLILYRTFGRLIPFDWFSFLLLKNGFHDSVSKTNVINE